MSEIETDAPLSTSLVNAGSALETDASTVPTVAGEILDAVPGQPQALLLLVSSLRLLGQQDVACEVLEWMAGVHPNLAAVRYELGLLLGRLGRTKEAIEHLSRVVDLEPNHPAAWRALGNQQARNGDKAAAGESYAEHVKRSIRELKLLEDAVAVVEADDLVKAENMLRQSLDINPTDVSMMRMLADVYVRLSRSYLARIQLSRALEIAPGYLAARESFAAALNVGMRWQEAIEQFDILIETSSRKGFFKTQKANNLAMLGEFERAFDLFHEVQPEQARNPSFWLNYGHTLRTVGRSEEMVDAYRESVEIDPGYGGGWYGLANLKTYRFSAVEIEAMRAQLKRSDLNDGNRASLNFALGQALEDQKSYAESFDCYREANALRRRSLHHDSASMGKELAKLKAFFNPELFRERAGLGCPSADPIFIVGMVRAGSTLIEQVLSSHSLVEGTMELPDLTDIVIELKSRRTKGAYPEMLADMDGAALNALGEKYLELTRCQRKTSRPFFTDKTGGNFWHVGLIQLILPNAKIIDARRHPLGCSFSIFKQVFPAQTVGYGYDLSEIGHNYRYYVEMMAHIDKVLPGKVHRVFHEDMVDDTEGEIRRLLEFCGLPFEESCLRFYETERSVRTSSSEQVRKPISRKGVETWQHYEPWLGPVKDALGDVLSLYPQVPHFD